MNTQILVVGIDGSPASAPVLRYALDEAPARGYTVRVVTCWSSTMTAKYGHGLPAATTYERAVSVLNSVIHQVATSARDVRLIVSQIDEG